MSAQPIKVMHVITRLVRGGAQRVVLDLLSGLDKKRFQLSLAAGNETGAEGSFWDEAKALQLPLFNVPNFIRDIHPYHDLSAFLRLYKLFTQERPKIVHLHTSKAGMLGCLAAYLARVPVILFAPHGHIFGTNAQITGVPAQGLKRLVLKKLTQWQSLVADKVILPNKVEQEEGLALQLFSPEKAHVIPNGIDTKRFIPGSQAEARKRLALEGFNGKLIGMVARLTPEKAVDNALKIMAQLPSEFALSIIGDGPERPQLEAQARKAGLEKRVFFHGFRSEIEQLMPAFDLLIVPSRSEAHGLVAAEAMACKIPVVASSVGGLKALLQEGKYGSLIPPDDHAAFAKAIKNVLAQPLDRAQQFQNAARTFIIEDYSLSAMLRKTSELYLSFENRFA